MNTIRLVLKVPFMRYPAGTVFELPVSNSYAGWDVDERVREKMSFYGKTVYPLPDGGRGYPVELHESDTSPCPPAAFDGVDLRTGPCRITATASGMGENMTAGNGTLPCGQLRENDTELVEINGINAQGIRVALPPNDCRPDQIILRDVLRGADTRSLPAFGQEVVLDLSDLLPGFYLAVFRYKNDCRHVVRFIKSFPLLVLLERNSNRFSTLQTLY